MGRYADFSWSVDPRGLAVHIEDEVKSRTLFLARRVYHSIVARTPVDSGNARANWNVSEGTPNYSYVNYKTEGGGLQAAMSKPFPITRLRSPYTVIHISNGTPYIDRLEFGWSKQAPQGMVRVTMAMYGLK